MALELLGEVRYWRYTVDRSVLKWDIQSSFYLMVFHCLSCTSIATETERQGRSHWTCLDWMKASWLRYWMNSHAGEPMRDIVDANIAVISHFPSKSWSFISKVVSPQWRNDASPFSFDDRDWNGESGFSLMVKWDWFLDFTDFSDWTDGNEGN